MKYELALMSNTSCKLHYKDIKEMLLVEDIDDRDFLNELLNTIVDKLPAPKKKN